VAQTVARLSPEHLHDSHLLLGGLYKALLPDRDWPSFPAYIDDLAGRDPHAMRDEVFGWMCSHDKLSDLGIEPIDAEAALADVQVYLDWVKGYYEKKAAVEKDFEEFDPNFYTELHSLLSDPPAMHNKVVTHLRMMWDDILESEWANVLPMLQESVEAFQQLDYSGSTALEAIRAVTGRDLTGHWEPTLGGANHIIFVPSAHIGPYVSWFTSEQGVAKIVFGARLPEGARVESPALSRSELLVRLSALADDTRLQILELMTRHDELCAQDIMTMLDLSQSSTSRHLRQLTATGYLVERRREVAKCYSLNPARFEDTVRALKRFARPRHRA
jgi:DNA-binding transcriptional ArsR family regulator